MLLLTSPCYAATTAPATHIEQRLSQTQDTAEEVDDIVVGDAEVSRWENLTVVISCALAAENVTL